MITQDAQGARGAKDARNVQDMQGAQGARDAQGTQGVRDMQGVEAPRDACGMRDAQDAQSLEMPSAVLHIEDVLASEGVFVSTSAGVSMWPLLRNRRDTVVIRPVSPGQRLRRFDVPLYRRGDDYVLHRIIEVQPDRYIIRGDNCLQREYVADDRVIGVLSELFRDGKRVSPDSSAYRAYVHVWHALFPLRACAKRLRACVGRAVRAMRTASAELGKGGSRGGVANDQ